MLVELAHAVRLEVSLLLGPKLCDRSIVSTCEGLARGRWHLQLPTGLVVDRTGVPSGIDADRAQVPELSTSQAWLSCGPGRSAPGGSSRR